MARTPTDPTKAEVWITKGLDDLDFEFYIPQGPKGDPGGWSASTVLSTGQSLDTVVTSGIYLNPSANNAAGPSNDLGYGGHLEVIASANWIVQRYTLIANPREIYVRIRNSSNTWSSWYTSTTQRVDQTAGRVIYQWDDVNNREQIVYGDTGWRDIKDDTAWNTAVFPTGLDKHSANTVRVRRVGSSVELMYAADKNSTAAVTATAAFPSGFRPTGVVVSLGSNSGLGLVRAYHGGGASNIIYQAPNAVSAVTFYFHYQTSDPWPTSLPGVAIGTIPNI